MYKVHKVIKIYSKARKLTHMHALVWTAHGKKFCHERAVDQRISQREKDIEAALVQPWSPAREGERELLLDTDRGC